MNLDPLETTEDPTRRDELVVEGVATPIKGDDEADISPRAAQENMKFFSQNSASNLSKSTEDTAHEADKRKHFQKLGSAAFVGMDGLNSPAPGGGRGMGGRGGQPARRRTFHNTPVSSADDHDPNNNSAAALMNMPAPRSRQAETPVTPFVRAKSQYAVGSDSLPATDTPLRPASMSVRKSVASSLFAGDVGDCEGGEGVDGGVGGDVGGGGSVGGKSTVSFADNSTTTNATANTTTLPTPHSSGIAAASTETTEEAGGVLLQYSTSIDETTHFKEVEAVRCDESTSSTNSTYSTYSDIVRTVPSVDADEVSGEVSVEAEGVCSGANTNNNSSYDIPVHAFSVDDVCDDSSNHAHIDTGSSIATITDTNDSAAHTEPTSNNTTNTINTANTNSTTNTDTNTPITDTTTTSTTHNTHTDTHEHNTHTSKNAKAFVAPTYIQHPVSYLKVGKGTVGISTSVSASANIANKNSTTHSGNNNSGDNVTNSSSAGKTTANTNTDSNTNTGASASASGASTDGCTNAERAKAMVSVGSVKDRIKKFETLKATDAPAPAPTSLNSDGKKNSFRRSSLS